MSKLQDLRNHYDDECHKYNSLSLGAWAPVGAASSEELEGYRRYLNRLREEIRTRETLDAWVSPHSHLDHGIPRDAIVDILIELQDDVVSALDADGIYKATHNIDKFGDLLDNLTSRLYGPQAGDDPVTEDEVFYNTRGDRPCRSRMIDKPHRPTRLVTIIVGLIDDKPTLFTAFGGPIAPREPEPGSSPDCEEAVFWRDHALAK